MQKIEIQHIIKRMVLTFCGVAILFSMGSCRRSYSQYQFKELPNSCWRVSDTLSFELDSIYGSGTYVLSLALRLSSADRYPYRDLVVEVAQNWAGRSVKQLDTLDCVLVERDGEVNGNGISIYSYEYPVDTISVVSGEQCRIDLRHLMRKNPLLGIYNVGVLLEYVGE